MIHCLLNGETASNDLSNIAESGLYSGWRVMTTMLARKKIVVDLDRHLDRLAKHAAEMNLRDGFKLELIKFEITGLIEKINSTNDIRLRIILFRDHLGQTSRYLSADVIDDQIWQERRTRGMTLSLLTDKTRERGSLIKTGILGTNARLLEAEKSKKFHDILWLNSDGEITESTWANIFLIGRTGDLVEIGTPPPSSGILEGITRRRISELLVAAKIPVTVRVITEDEIPRFDEAFLTSSLQGLMPVVQIGTHRLHTLRPNAVFSHIARLYSTWLSLADQDSLPNKDHSQLM